MVDCGFFGMRGENRIHIEIGLRQRNFHSGLGPVFYFLKNIP